MKLRTIESNKVVASLVVLGVCAVALTGTAYAYNAIHQSYGTITSDYVELSLLGVNTETFSFDHNIVYNTVTAWDSQTSTYKTTYSAPAGNATKVLVLKITDDDSNATTSVRLTGQLSMPSQSNLIDTHQIQFYSDSGCNTLLENNTVTLDDGEILVYAKITCSYSDRSTTVKPNDVERITVSLTATAN